ncbi:tRNA (N6-threonylcarbamoyladenosine(37)-N6)-methyltransferase TrmO [Oceanidesulfovibrio marinus]|uniref:tRNA (N6-threonylcarbamoyladenosine(37)-N6)-methyltransferase TrmO n=1 Tax=Oceanidesulfovibrio marinus TaxID=370038 RepID=A0A6P1ZDC7_9BACT|nr:tRNA (N6-threonylcarbamoyladenosine(37)-N6)-methyltransferase TrmO [Oceanidesulfovibrio marinus]QJT09753.1 tRNA (N6-threonylcarbamoyladenosine(37)-N6)-methyltransferase TrmO [Oceanidesulfovibrio marinus]TVM31565.1 tRNA (N6-threonylcarbamoyladenosine(37)-N6)-methyltransferase TrmO [Oceanidesulfovibrio marinus]
MTIPYSPIGFFKTLHKNVAGTPDQPSDAIGMPGNVLVLPEYQGGLQDLVGFSHVILLYHMHEAAPRGTEPRGVFATRSPARPNPIGMSVLRLNAIRDGVVLLENVDVLDGTPVLDIKPYIPDFDVWPAHCPDRTGAGSTPYRSGENAAC